MKLFTKEVDKQLFAQYPKGSDLENQMVVAKIFNPYGRGVWYLLNSDPEDPDYIWAIVDLFEPDMGSVSRSELQTVKVPPFGLGLERDIYFTPKPAKEVWEGVMRGERFAYGGMTVGRYYKDNSGNELRYIGESEGKLLFKDGEKIIFKSHEDFEDEPKENKLFGFFAKGGEVTPYIVWVSKDGEKRELFGEYKSKRAADMQMNKLWAKGEYKQMGNKPKSMYEKEGFYADGGRVKGKNNQTGESYGVVIGSVKKSDEYVDGGTEMNVRTSYSSRISESKIVFDNNGNLYGILDFGYAVEGYPNTESGGSFHAYNADKKETLEVLSKEYNPAFAKKLVALAKDSKMADGGETAAAEHNIKQAKYGGKMAKGGGIYSSDSLYYLQVLKDGEEVDKKKFRARSLKEAKEISEDEYEGDYEKKYGKNLTFIVSEAMGMGGKVKFEDKVKAVQKSLLKRKKVAPVVQKDYGKTYNKKEALESARRIIGAQTAKWEKRNKK